MHKQRLAKNTTSSLLYQIISIICGFVIPRLILDVYGSVVNGVVNSIARFLSFVSFLEFGMGAVITSALYKPLAERNWDQINRIIHSAEKFFRRIATILFGYVVTLILLYPRLSHQQFSFSYTATLIVVISISSFAQYYFGIVNTLLLNADQRGYVQYTVNSIALIVNAISCVFLVKIKAPIQIVKLVGSLVFIIRPLFLRWYVDRNYQLNRTIPYEKEPIPQKWNGIAQHISSVVLDNTDTIILTMFATLQDVSVYSVYNLVVSGVKTLFISLANGIQALIGELWARQEHEELNLAFSWIEWAIHTGVTFTFGCTGVLIVPFVTVYTNGVADTNYIQTLFAVLIVMANAGHCLRLPYNIVILAAGHYKQTQYNYLLAAAMNIVLSIALVKKWGLVGVAIGTLAAMLFQTVWMAWYNSVNLIHWPLKAFFRQLLVDFMTVILTAFVAHWFTLQNNTYFAWIILAVEVVIIASFIMIVVNAIFYRDKLRSLISIVRHKFINNV